VAHHIVDVDVVIHVPLLGSERLRDINGKGLRVSRVMGDAAWIAVDRALIALVRLGVGRNVRLF
jgi:hypothetical protein